MIDTLVINHRDDPSAAEALAARLSIPISTQPPPGNEILLHITDNGLSLQQNSASPPAPIHIDFSTGKSAYRRGQGELIAKAVGLHKKKHLSVIDATAGLGRDAYVLATQGCQVTLIERHPLIHCLLENAIQRAAGHPDTQDPASRLQLIHDDAAHWLAGRNTADVVYLDPMYPQNQKSAKAKKEMQLFHALLQGKTDSGNSLLPLAKQRAKRRVVVKRPIKGVYLNGEKPDFQVTGRSTRFDVYLTHTPQPE